MTIANSLLFTRKSWAFPREPGMPAGVWSATGEDEGDASGGSQTWQHIFSSPGNNLGDSNFYSIEQAIIATGPSTSLGCTLTLNGMDTGSGRVGTPRNPVTRVYGIEFFDSDNGVSPSSGVYRQVMHARDMNPHLWVGTYEGIPTDFGDVLVRIQNPGASEESTVALYGYWWTPEAINAARGLRRPAEYVFSP